MNKFVSTFGLIIMLLHNLTALAANEAPKLPSVSANNDVYNVLVCDAPFTFNILANDRLPEKGYRVELENRGSVKGSKARIEGNNLVYTPAPGYTGADVLTYVVKAGPQASTGAVTIYMKNEADSTIEASIKAGEEYQFGEESLSSTGVYIHKLKAHNGCDSVVTLKLRVGGDSLTYLEKTICLGDRVQFGTEWIKTRGFYTQTLTASSGQDSVVALNLQVHAKLQSTVRHSICQGSGYSFGGKRLTDTGLYTHTVGSKAGCDSTINLILTVMEPVYVDVTERICQGESYTFGERTLSEAGFYYQTLNSSIGCDSIVTLNLKVTAPVDTTITDTICYGASYTFFGEELKAAGSYQHTLKSAAGCDSTVHLDLYVRATADSTVNATICEGGSYTFGALQLTEAGTYTQELTASTGCDSVVTLHLKLQQPVDTTITDTICQGGAYLLGSKRLTQAGTYSETLVSGKGCDSTVHLTLVVLDRKETTLNASVCKGESYEFGSQTLDKAGDYSLVLEAASGCDSTVNLHLTILEPDTTRQQAHIYKGETYTFGERELTSTGVYTRKLVAENGCDSVVILDLQVIEGMEINLYAHICDNETYTFGEEILDKAGVYTHNLKTAAGTDSIVTLNLNVLDTFATEVKGEIMFGSSYPFNGQNVYYPGTYKAVLTANNGCDSVVTLKLNVGYPTVPGLQAKICEGDSYNFFGEELTTEGYYLHIETTEAGDEIATAMYLKVMQPADTTIFDTICQNSTYTFAGSTLTTAGTYSHTFRASYGCDSVVTLKLHVVEAYNIALSSDTVCEGTTYTFAGESYTLDAGSHALEATQLSAHGCDSTIRKTLVVLAPSHTDVYDTTTVGSAYKRNGFDLGELAEAGDEEHELATASRFGCDSTVTLHLNVKPSTDIPTIFSPENQDGINDVFMIGCEVYIYDRYGNLISHSKNGWDGRYRGKFADPGVYVYVVLYTDGDKRKGTVEVLKN